jgi:hypothetical protein
MKRAVTDIEQDNQVLQQIQKLHKRCDDLWSEYFDSTVTIVEPKTTTTTSSVNTTVTTTTTTSNSATTTINEQPQQQQPQLERQQVRVCIVSSEALIRATTRLPVHRDRTLLLFKLIQAYRLMPTVVAPRMATDSELLTFHDEAFIARLCSGARCHDTSLANNIASAAKKFDNHTNDNNEDDDEATNGLTHDCLPFEGQEGACNLTLRFYCNVCLLQSTFDWWLAHL